MAEQNNQAKKNNATKEIIFGLTLFALFCGTEYISIKNNDYAFREAMPAINTVDSTYNARRDSLRRDYHVQVDSIRELYTKTFSN